MRYCLSAPALLAALAAAGPAAAQAVCPGSAPSLPCNPSVTAAHAENLLSAYPSYLSSVAGRTLLDANLATEVSVYDGASLALRQLAATNDISVGAFNNLGAPIFGPVLGPAGTFLAAGIGAGMISTSTAQTLLSAAAVSLHDSDQMKTTFGGFNVSGIAYGAVSADPNGDPRPYQVTNRIADHSWSKLGLDPSLAQQQHEAWKSNAESPSYPSGHSTYGHTMALLYAVMVPELYQPFLRSGLDFAYSRNVLGVHYPLDVIAGRILATHDLVQLLNADPAYVPTFASGFQAATAEMRAAIEASCGGTIAACLANGSIAPSGGSSSSLDLLTYGLPSVGPTNLAPVVPLGAEVLLATRFPYLTSLQRRDVLASTELPSGVPLDNGSGWARLDLLAAAGGYGSLTSDVTVRMDAARGGFNALDTWSNDIGGSGGLTKTGSGTLVLSGRDTYAGGTTIRQGAIVLTGSLIGDLTIARGARFVSSGGYALAPSATLRNDGILTTVGTPLSVAGLATNGGILEGAVANRGTFVNDGLVTGAFTNRGILSGTGTVGGLSVLSGGTVAPGGSIGTLGVRGNVAFASASTYDAEVSPSGASDAIVASGRADLAGGVVAVSTAPGLYGLGTVYPILQARGGVAGAFAGLSRTNPEAAPFQTFALGYTANQVSLRVGADRRALRSAAATPNEAAVAAAVADLPETSPVLSAASQLASAAAARLGFDSLSGEIHAAVARAAYGDARMVRDALLTRLRAREDAVHAGIAGTPTGPDATRPALWGEGFGSWGASRGRAHGDGGSAPLDTSTGGFVLGADASLAPAITLGLAGGFTRTTTDLDARLSSASNESVFGALTGGASWGPVGVRAGIAYARHDIETRRTAQVASLTDVLSATGDGSTAQAFGEIGYRLEGRDAFLEPILGASVLRLRTDGFLEEGGAFALAGASRVHDLATSTLGLRGEIRLGQDGPLALRGLVGWRRAYGDVDPDALLAFAGGTLPFTISAAPVDRDALVVEAGLDWRASDSLSLGVSYAGQVGGIAGDHALKGNLTWRFATR
ncbi:MAG: autotransporter domain-containing protein [Microvirga sp.]